MERPDLEGYLALVEGRFKEEFSAFETLLVSHNRKCNLTAITSHGEILVKHFLDSLAGEFLFPAGARVLEVGSGGGFPSIPLKIVRKDLAFTLVESTGKKCDFLREAVRELGAEKVEVLQARAEDAAREETYREKYDVCCARAVARLNTLAEYCLPFVRPGGKFVAYKGELKEEAEEAGRAIALLGGRIGETISFSLPGEAGKRTLVVVEKIRPTPAKYPRGRGKERSAPII